MKLIDVVSASVLSGKLPGEENTSIKIGEVNLVLGRYPQNDLYGMRVVGGNGTFQFPTSDDLLLKTENTTFIDIQVGMVSCTTQANCLMLSLDCRSQELYLMFTFLLIVLT